MPKPKKPFLDEPATILRDDDPEILAAIADGLRDVEAGRTVPTEKIRELLPQWITASSKQ